MLAWGEKAILYLQISGGITLDNQTKKAVMEIDLTIESVRGIKPDMTSGW